MKVLVLLTLCLAASHARSRSVKDASAGYHARVGIPLATQIKLAEDQGQMTLSQRIAGGSIVDISQVPYHVGVSSNFALSCEAGHPASSTKVASYVSWITSIS